MSEHDPVNSPSHYMVFPDVEAIDIIEETLTPEEFRGYLKGNCLKYRLRSGFKDDTVQDIEKAKWYQDRLFEKHELRQQKIKERLNKKPLWKDE